MVISFEKKGGQHHTGRKFSLGGCGCFEVPRQRYTAVSQLKLKEAFGTLILFLLKSDFFLYPSGAYFFQSTCITLLFMFHCLIKKFSSLKDFPSCIIFSSMIYNQHLIKFGLASASQYRCHMCSIYKQIRQEHKQAKFTFLPHKHTHRQISG